MILLGLFCAALVSAEAAAPLDLTEQARGQIEQFHQVLGGLGELPEQRQREERLRPVIESVFDTQRIAGISLGRTWRTLEAPARETFVALLTDLIVATYAERFGANSSPQFVTDEVKGVKSGAVVQTRILRSDDEPVTLDYFVRPGGVFNVVANGVSDLSLRRADYNSIIKEQGYEALLTHIRQKIQEARSAS